MLVVLQAQPLVLPLRECPGAWVKATRMIGQRIAEFRSAVETLRRRSDACISTMYCALAVMLPPEQRLNFRCAFVSLMCHSPVPTGFTDYGKLISNFAI
jgi:hypothetical protein